MIKDFEVEYEAINSAAKKIKSAVADGTVDTAGASFGTKYGHEAMAAALLTFTDDAAHAVKRFAAETKDLSDELTEQVARYRAVDDRIENVFANPDLLSVQSELPPPLWPPSLPGSGDPFAAPAGSS